MPLKGYASYLTALTLILTGVLHQLGYLSTDMTATIVTVLLGTGIASLRRAIKNLK